MLVPMTILATLAVFIGIAAARSIVAEADAHRLRGADAWWAPVCSACGGALNPFMTHCGPARHRQRIANVLVLIGTPVLLVALVFAVPSLWIWPAYASFGMAMVLLGVTDLDTKLIPNRILGPATLLTATLLVAGWALAGDAGSVLRAGAGALAYFAAMYVLAVLARGGLGFGDVKLAFLIGMVTGFLGWGHVVVAGVSAFILGGVTAVVLLVTRRSGRKDAIPFGPFMIVAGVIAVLWGTDIVDWYLR